MRYLVKISSKLINFRKFTRISLKTKSMKTVMINIKEALQMKKKMTTTLLTNMRTKKIDKAYHEEFEERRLSEEESSFFKSKSMADG